MVKISKADWKLFRERIGGWQEAHMEKLNKEYVALLNGEGQASKKFWALEERIREDKKTPGVQLWLEKSEIGWDLIALLNSGVITADDLDGFSKELKEFVISRVRYRFPKEDPTIQYYEAHAEEFAANTINADMEDIRSRFLAHLPAGARVLDFGCGTGRDTKAFRDLGYEVTALDGSEALCRIAGDYTGIPVRCVDFRDYTPAEGECYDGIWACASLLHLKKNELLAVMQALGKALDAGGIFYISFKYGDFEGERNGRYFTDFTPDGFCEYMKMLPEFRMMEHWVTGDVRPGRGDERWLNMLLERTEFHT